MKTRLLLFLALILGGGLIGCSTSAHRSVLEVAQEEQPGTIHIPPPAQTQKQAEGINPKNTDMAGDEIAKFYHLDVDDPRDEDRIRIAHDFPNLTPENQYLVLDLLWPQARCPEFADALLPFAKLPKEPEQENVETLCDEVIIHLLDLKPEAVRPLILQDLRRPRPLFAMCVLRALPDKELPELDDILLANWNNREDDSEKVALVIERYASPRIMPQVMAFYQSPEKGWDCLIQAAILRYRLKYDRPAGLQAIEKAVNFREITGCYKTVLGDTLRDSLDRDSEKLVLKYVNDPDPEVAADAKNLLAQYYSGYGLDYNTNNWPMFYDCEKGPVCRFISCKPQTLEAYTNAVPIWNDDLLIPKAKINSSEIEELGRFSGLRVVEARLSLKGTCYTDTLMILEEVRRNQFLPVYVQDYNRAIRVPLADVVRMNKAVLLIDTGMDYSGTGGFQSHYKIIISPQRKPRVVYLSGGIEN